MGTNLGVVCQYLKIGPSLELVILKVTRAEPIFIKQFLGPVKIISQFRQAMGVTEMDLVSEWKFMGKTWLLEHPLMITEKGQCKCLRFREKHGRRRGN